MPFRVIMIPPTPKFKSLDEFNRFWYATEYKNETSEKIEADRAAISPIWLEGMKVYASFENNQSVGWVVRDGAQLWIDNQKMFHEDGWTFKIEEYDDATATE